MQTRAHAAAALAQLRDLSLLRTMQPSAVVQSLEAAAAVLQVNLSCEPHTNHCRSCFLADSCYP